MSKITNTVKRTLLNLYVNNNITLRGDLNFLLNDEKDNEFKEYLIESQNKSSNVTLKKETLNEKIKKQNEELIELNKQNELHMENLNQALKDAEETKFTLKVKNEELEAWKSDSIKLAEDLHNQIAVSERSKIEAEQSKQEALKAKETAENDLDLLQKRSQTELISRIVKVALWIIIGVGVTTTIVYMVSLFLGVDTEVMSATWANIFGILLTNAFSIVGTIMGIKYATENKQ